MNKRIRNCYRALLGSALGLLGFESCNNVTEMPDEYGAPYATYQIRGTVTDEDGKPIEGIKGRLGVEVTNPDGSKSLQFESGDSALTDAEGRLSINETLYYFSPEEAVLALEDIDGEAKDGEFAPDVIDLDDMKKELKEEGKGWYEGTFEYSFERKLSKKSK